MAIDSSPVTEARAALRDVGQQACQALRHAKHWSQVRIAEECGQPVQSLKRVLGRSEASVAAGICLALDEVCAEYGLGPFGVAAARERWKLCADDARHQRTGPSSVRLQVGYPPAPALAFQARKAMMPDLQSRSARTATTALTVFVGDAGVGKTQQARSVWDCVPEDTHIKVWVTGRDRESVSAAYTQAAIAVGLIGADESAVEEAPQRFLAWLARTWMSWLIVIDDVQASGRDLLDLLPPASRTGRTMITTRRTDWALPRADCFRMMPFSPSQSTIYLRQRLQADDRAVADVLTGVEALAVGLGGLPLALAQAASYIPRRGRTCASYLAEFTNRRARIRDLFPKIDPADGYTATVATTWTFSVEAADELEPVGLASAALHLAAFLEPAGVPDAVWTAEPSLRYLQSCRERPPTTARTGSAAVTKTEALDALRNLHLFSVIDHQLDSSTTAGRVSTHSLVQRVTREVLTDKEVRNVAETVADTLLQQWDAQGLDVALLYANALTLFAELDLDALTPGLHPLYLRVSDRLADLGRPQAARDLLGPVADTVGVALDAPSARQFGVRRRMATWRADTGDITGAAGEFRLLLADQQQAFGVDSQPVRITRRQLAGLRGQSGQHADAIAELGGLLEEQSATLGPDSAEVLKIRASLAMYQGLSGDHETAATSCADLAADCERLYGADDPETVQVRAQYAIWKGAAGDADTAAEAFAGLVQDQRRILGPEHPRTLMARANFAYWLGRAGETDEALDEFERLQVDYEDLLGPRHPHTLMNRGNIAYIVLTDRRDFPAAHALLTALLRDFESIHGDNHPYVMQTRELIQACLAHMPAG